MGTAVDVSVNNGIAVGGIGVEVEITVSVVIVGEVGDGEEQEVRRERKRKEQRRMCETLWRNMDGILSHLLALSLMPHFGLTKQ